MYVTLSINSNRNRVKAEKKEERKKTFISVTERERERDGTVGKRLVKGWMALRRFSRSRQDLSSDGSVNSVTPVNKYG